MYDEYAGKMQQEDKEAAFPVLLQTVFLLTPVISTTFHNTERSKEHHHSQQKSLVS